MEVKVRKMMVRRRILSYFITAAFMISSSVFLHTPPLIITRGMVAAVVELVLVRKVVNLHQNLQDGTIQCIEA